MLKLMFSIRFVGMFGFDVPMVALCTDGRVGFIFRFIIHLLSFNSQHRNRLSRSIAMVSLLIASLASYLGLRFGLEFSAKKAVLVSNERA